MYIKRTTGHKGSTILQSFSKTMWEATPVGDRQFTKPRTPVAQCGQCGQFSGNNFRFVKIERTFRRRRCFAAMAAIAPQNTNPISSASRTRRPLHIVLYTVLICSAQTSSASRKRNFSRIRLEDSQSSSRHRAPTPCVGRCAVRCTLLRVFKSMA